MIFNVLELSAIVAMYMLCVRKLRILSVLCRCSNACWTVGSSWTVRSEVNMDVCCLASFVVKPMVDSSYHDESVLLSSSKLVMHRELCATFWNFNDCLGTIGTGCGLASKDEVSINEGMIGGEKLACDGVINVILLVVGMKDWRARM